MQYDQDQSKGEIIGNQCQQVNQSMYSLWARENLSSPERAGILALDPLGGGSQTYAEMSSSIQRLATSLNALCRNEQMITHCGLTAVDSVSLFWAANAIGKTVNYVFPEFIAMDPVGYVEATGTKTVVVLDAFYPMIAEALAKIKIDRVVISSLSDYAEYIDAAFPDPLKAMMGNNLCNEIRGSSPKGLPYDILSWNEFMEIGTTQPLSIQEMYQVPENDVAGVFYSGGSTGRPKGIQLMNYGLRQMYANYQDMPEIIGVRPGDRYFTHVPMGHVTASVHMVIMPMLHGSTLAMQPMFNTTRLLDDLRMLKPHHVIASPSQHIPLAMRPDLRDGELSFIKRVVSGAEKLFEKDYVKIAAAYRRAGTQYPLLDGYGMSEFGAMVSLGDVNSKNWMLPLPSVMMRIVDDADRILSGDEVGRLQVSTETRMLGYYGNPDDTTKFFVTDGDTMWGDTGDIAERRGEYYDVLGRDSELASFTAKDGTRVRGMLVDNFLLRNSSISEAQTIALSVKGEAETHVLAVHIVLEPGFDGNKNWFLAETIRSCRAMFKAPLLPSAYKIRDRFALNATIHKRDVPALMGEYDGFVNLVDGELVEVPLVREA